MTEPKTIVVSAANNAYTPLVNELFQSIRALKFRQAFDLGLLDVGIEPDVRQHFLRDGIHVVTAESDIEFPGRRAWEAKKPGVRTLTARPFLRRYFPGYDVYIWLDADVWVQTPEAINTMIEETAHSNAISIACEMDRCYQTFFDDATMWHVFRGWYEACYSPDIVASMALKPMLNAGVFAMGKNSPLWDAWAEIYRDALQHTPDFNEKTFMADQLGLNILLYLKGMPCIVLPAYYNWLTFYALPKLDQKMGLYVEPLPPFKPISQFHLTRSNKVQVETIACLDGETVERSLVFSARRGK